MADDKIDADKQRGNPPKEANIKEPKTSKQSERSLLEDIKETLVAQSGIRADSVETETGALRHLERIANVLDKQNETIKTLSEVLTVGADIQEKGLEGSSVKKANDLESAREEMAVFQEMVQLLKNQPAEIAKALNQKQPSDGDGGTGGSKALQALGIGKALQFAGPALTMMLVGLGAAAKGLGVFLLAMVAADAIAAEFGNEGKSLKNVLINLGEGLASMGGVGLAALGAILAAGVFGGTRGGKGVAAIGFGLAGFFLALGATEKGLSWMGSNYTGLTPIFKNFSNAMDALSSTALATLGVLLGASAVFGPKRMSKAAAGMTAIGAGIGGFFLGLGAADAGLTWMNADGSMLVTQVKNMTDAFGYLGENKTALKVLGGLMVAGAIFGAAPGGMKMKGKAVLGMGLIGLGIGAFFAGLGAGDAALTWMNSDGSNLKAIMVNIAEGLSAFKGDHLKGMLAVGGIFAVVSAIPGGLAAAGMATVGLGLAGLGIGAFISGMAIGGGIASFVGADGTGLKNILTNMAGGLQEMGKVNGKNLFEVVEAMSNLGPAMISVLTGKTVTTVGDFVLNLRDTLMFWKDEGPSPFQKMADGIKHFEKLSGPKLSQAAINVEKLGVGMSAWGTIDADDITENVKASAAAMELLEKTLIGGNPKLANLEPVVDFKGILNIEGIEEGAAEIEKIQQALFALPNSTGIEINSSSLADQIADKLMNLEKSSSVNIINQGDHISQHSQNFNQNGSGDGQTQKSLCCD